MLNRDLILIEALLNELMDSDPDFAERFIQKQLAKVELNKRLNAYKEFKKQRLATYFSERYPIYDK